MTSDEWKALVRAKGMVPAAEPWRDPRPDLTPDPSAPDPLSIAPEERRTMPARALRHQVQHIGLGR